MIFLQIQSTGDGRDGVFDAFIYLLRDPAVDQGVQKPTPQTFQKAHQGNKSRSKHK